LVEKITKKDSSGNVFQSAVAFGEWSNINNAKDILSMLMIQAGTPITSRSGTAVISVLNSQFSSPTVPAQSALEFYTKFSNQHLLRFTQFHHSKRTQVLLIEWR
jgi:hypothetical protein